MYLAFYFFCALKILYHDFTHNKYRNASPDSWSSFYKVYVLLSNATTEHDVNVSLIITAIFRFVLYKPIYVATQFLWSSTLKRK